MMREETFFVWTSDGASKTVNSEVYHLLLLKCRCALYWLIVQLSIHEFIRMREEIQKYKITVPKYWRKRDCLVERVTNQLCIEKQIGKTFRTSSVLLLALLCSSLHLVFSLSGYMGSCSLVYLSFLFSNEVGQVVINGKRRNLVSCI